MRQNISGRTSRQSAQFKEETKMVEFLLLMAYVVSMFAAYTFGYDRGGADGWDRGYKLGQRIMEGE